MTKIYNNQIVTIMKKSYLSQIMKDAWAFFKITGKKFSICLERSWANYKLVQTMHQGVVAFYYRLNDGKIRQAYGTLKDKSIPTCFKKRNLVQSYYDMETGWRFYGKLDLIIL